MVGAVETGAALLARKVQLLAPFSTPLYLLLSATERVEAVSVPPAESWHVRVLVAIVRRRQNGFAPLISCCVTSVPVATIVR